MSGRLLKCYGDCNNKHLKEDLVKVGTQNFCKPCAAIKEKEKNDRAILYKTIQTIFQIPWPTGQMLKQISDFGTERNYTLEGMTKTLCYFVKVQRKVPFKNGGLAFIPWNYDNAIKYYEEQEEKRKNSTDFNNEKVIIRISPIEHKTEVFRAKKIIDMGAILQDG